MSQSLQNLIAVEAIANLNHNLTQLQQPTYSSLRVGTEDSSKIMVKIAYLTINATF
ncbi:MAG: hypothetical protein RMZ41_014025 [Nostoc sp. DedVER02]|uniref:hypothetical protein n=1 Tax=unclassified Nostoc TaxID=2593658 RepID=UPI002AD4E6F1|nr:MULTISPECIES: hypothetical protein [unclassified Nostoc]MDZ7987364.1 hypothetical protein [Nostoc sp. DedVER02]